MSQLEDDKTTLHINRLLQFGLSIIGAMILVIFWQSWRDVAHLVYDIPTGLVISGYIAQIVCEGINRGFTSNWWIRVWLLLPMTIIPAGRWFLGWPVSGHLSIMLAVAVMQSLDKRLNVMERVVYWIPVPIILYMRWFYFDKDGHWDMYNALLVSVVLIFVYMAGVGITRRFSTRI